MALWRVLALYKRDASRRGQAPAKQTLSAKNQQKIKAERLGKSCSAFVVRGGSLVT